MKKLMKKIVAMLCVAVMVFNIAYVPKMVAEAATASESDAYKFIGVNHLAKAVNGAFSWETGSTNSRLASTTNGTVTTLDGVTFDALINFSANSTFTLGGWERSTHRLDFRAKNAGGVDSLQIVFTNSATTDNGNITVTATELGYKNGFLGTDVRVRVSMLYSNVDTTNNTANVKAVVKVGPTYTTTLTVTNFPLSSLNDAGGVITGYINKLTVKAVKADTDYRVVSVQDFTGLKEFTATENATKGATGVTSFDNVLLDGIYNFAAVGPHFNIGSGVNGLQINPVKYNNGGYYMRYQILDCSKTNRSVYGNDVSTTVLGSEVINTDIRIRVGFSYANVTTTDGVTTADVTVHIKIGESYEDIFTAYGYQITNNLIVQDVKTEVEGVLADRDNVLVAFNNVAVGAITVTAGPTSDFVEVTPADFNYADRHDEYVNQDTTGSLKDTTTNSEVISLDKKVLSVDVHFDGAANENTYVGIQSTRWTGLAFAKSGENQFVLKDTENALIQGKAFIDAQKVGLSSASEAFNLKISIEYVDLDFDGDELVDDIKYGVYINDRLCLVAYATATANGLKPRFRACYATQDTTLQVSSPEPQAVDTRTPYILEDFGVEEQVYDKEVLEDGYYFQDIGAVSEGGSSVTGTVALSGDAALTLYGNGAPDNKGLTVLEVENATKNVNHNHNADGYKGADSILWYYPEVSNLDGYMIDGTYSFSDMSANITFGHPNAGGVMFRIVKYNGNGKYYLRCMGRGDSYTEDILMENLGYSNDAVLGADIPIKIGFSCSVDNVVTVYINVANQYENTFNFTTKYAPSSLLNRITINNAQVGVGTIGIKANNPVVFTEEGVRFEMTDSGLVFNSNLPGLRAPISIPFADVTDGEEFTFTVQEEIFDLDLDGAKDDVRLSVWVNGQMAGNKRYYITDVAGKFSKAVYITPGTTATSGVTVKPSLNAEAYNLDDTENGYLVSGLGVLTVNDESKANGDVIGKAGDYIVRSAQKGAYIKSVVLYKAGNAHMDEETDVIDVLDLVALKKAANGQKLATKSAQKGADVDNNNVVNDTDGAALRNLLVGNVEVLPRRVTHEEGVMPIVGFYGPYRAEDTKKNVSYDFITEDIYQMVKEVGINQISYTSNADYRLQPQAVIDSLELAEKYGIGLYVNDTRFSGALDTTSYANYLKDYMKYKSFKGFFLVDEPSTSDLLDKYQIGRDMSIFADKMNLVNSFSNTMGYMNMYPKSVVGKVIGPNHIAGVSEDGVYANETSYKANRLTNIANDKITSLNNVVFDGVFNFSSNGAFGIGGHCNGAANRLQMSVVTEKGVTYFRYQLVGASGTTVNLTADDLGCQFVDKDLRITIRFILENVVDDTADVTVKIKIGPNYENRITAKNYNIDGTFVNSGGVVVGPMGKVSVKALDKDAVYRNYINTCVAPGMKYLSWDYYTFDGAAKKSEYFEHLSIMRGESATRGLPFWGFVQAGSRWNDAALDLPEANTDFPSASEVMWNANTTLAYGAKGIQWFPLIQPFTFAYEDSEDGYDYNRNGLIAANGEKTRWYDYAKAANQQIALVDEYLLYAESLDVLAIGSTAQSETGIEKTTYGSLLTGVTASKGALVGVFNYQGRTAFYVVNYDTSESNTGADTITLNFNTNQTWEVHSTQLAANVSATSGTSCALSLNNGGAALVILK